MGKHKVGCQTKQSAKIQFLWRRKDTNVRFRKQEDDRLVSVPSVRKNKEKMEVIEFCLGEKKKKKLNTFLTRFWDGETRMSLNWASKSVPVKNH